MSGPNKIIYTEEIQQKAITYWANPDGTAKAPLVAFTDLVTLGDSLSTENHFYPEALRDLYPDRAVFSLGSGGQITKQIAGRFGGAPVALSGISGGSIPTTPTAVTLSVDILTVALRSIEGTVNGSLCELTRTSGGTHTIRSLTGSAVPAAPGVLFVPKSNVYYISWGESKFSLDDMKGRTVLIWAGRNDANGSAVNTADLVADINGIIGQLSSYVKRYLVLGCINGIGDTEAAYGGTIPTGTESNARLAAVNQINVAYASAFGDRFVDILAHMVAQPGASTSVTPTGSGNTYSVLRGTSTDQTGGALLSDGIHMNQAGGAVVAARIKSILDSKGW